MAAGRRGRPRSDATAESGLGTAEDILAAAARLFCEVGYGSTSTYMLAREARVSQATMYHYFSGKQALLLELLLRTVRPSRELADRLSEADEPAEVRLWALVHEDVGLLASGRNVGALYLLPELYATPDGGGSNGFEAFHRERAALRHQYEELARAVLRTTPWPRTESYDRAAGLVLGTVESVILTRREQPHVSPTSLATGMADAVLRMLGVGDDRLAAAQTAATALIADQAAISVA